MLVKCALLTLTDQAFTHGHEVSRACLVLLTERICMPKKEPHVHAFKRIELVPVVADNPKWNRELFGGFAALLVRTCDCTAQQAFEFGTRGQMENLFKELTHED
jgi:hypothetical protein